jgi:hypothetical protein
MGNAMRTINHEIILYGLRLSRKIKIPMIKTYIVKKVFAIIAKSFHSTRLNTCHCFRAVIIIKEIETIKTKAVKLIVLFNN